MNLKQYWNVLKLLEQDGSAVDAKSQAIIAELAGITIEQLMKLSLAKFMELSESSRIQLESISKQAECKDSYIIEDNVFKCIRDAKQMNAIQFIHLMTILNTEDLNKRLHSVCALMLIPEGVTYPDYNVAKVEQLILNNLDICDVFAIVGEASGLFNTFSKPIMDYLIDARKIQRAEGQRRRRSLTKRIFQRNGGLSHG